MLHMDRKVVENIKSAVGRAINAANKGGNENEYFAYKKNFFHKK